MVRREGSEVSLAARGEVDSNIELEERLEPRNRIKSWIFINFTIFNFVVMLKFFV